MKKKRWLLCTLLALSLLLSLVPSESASAEYRGSINIKAGGTSTLIAKGGYPWTWSVENGSIVRIEPQGNRWSNTYGYRCKITGLREGTTTVRLRGFDLVYDPNAPADWFGDHGENVSRERIDTWTVTVTGSQRPLNRVKVTSRLSIKRKKSSAIKVTLPKGLAKNGQAKITYKTNNKKVATVNSKGRVTAKKKGSAKITTTVRLRNGTKKTFATKVTVK